MGMSEQQIYWIGKHGFRLTGMPAFTDMMTDDELWKTALFIKHMSQLPPAVEEAWRKP
jgi:mono/diheme cytochrome c family protein